MEEDEEGRKGAALEEKEAESQGKKDVQEKLNTLFIQPADPWVSTGGSPGLKVFSALSWRQTLYPFPTCGKTVLNLGTIDF